MGGATNYKTVPCKYFMQDGVCNFGDKCSFAHGVQDLRAKQLVDYTQSTSYIVDPVTGLRRLAPTQEEVVLRAIDDDNVVTKIMKAASLIKSN